MVPSIEKLTRYLSYGGRNGSMELTSDENEEMGRALIWKVKTLPWNGPTCLAIVCHVLKFTSKLAKTSKLNDTIRRLNNLASERDAVLWKLADDYENPERWIMESIVEEKNQEIAETFVENFMPEVREFFRVPNLQQLSEKDKSLKENQTLAGFIDFLLQILNSESLINLDEEEKYARLRKELTFLLTFLGDIPFQCTDLEEVKNLMAEFENFANEVGSFIYSCVFSSRPVKASRFYGGRDLLLEKVEVLNEKIKEHCIKFSELPRFATPRTNTSDSFFIIDSLLEDLHNLMHRRFNFAIDCMQNLIKSLHEELSLAQSFVKDIILQHGTEMDEAKKSQVEIIDAAYEAEYLVNSHVVGNAPLWYLNLRIPSVIKKIKVIGVRVQDMKKSYDSEVLKIAKDFIEISSKDLGTPVAVAHNIVEEFADEKTKILADITGGPQNRTTISIFGMPGLGKTTVAKNLYNDRAIYDYFDQRVWCVVSQVYEKRKVLIDILRSIASNTDKENIMKMDDGILGLQIYQILNGRRYLIVMDDVWCPNIWDDLIRFFPDDANGSRIMVTSRNKDTAPTDSIFHTLPRLSEVQCWALLVEKVFPNKPCPPQLVGIGKKIAAKCYGLPLAVVVIAGLLANSQKEESVWRKVEANLDAHIFDDQSGCIKILELSYNYLPVHLKPCFLYLGAFRVDREIPTRELILLWIAEGFIRKEKEKRLENIAEEYLTDLKNRSLLMIARRRSDGGIKACSFHDLLRDMCLRKAYEENFLKPIKENITIFEKHHHLCVNSATKNYLRPFGLHCRSFLGHLSDPSSCFPQMPLLRVMHLLPTWGGSSELRRINLLVHLRYLVVDRMPEPVVGNLVNLEFLRVESSLINYVSSVILTMVKLKHLHIKSEVKFEKDCDSHQTTNLRSFSFVQIKHKKDEEILKTSPHLNMLKCRCDEILFPDIGSFTELESLKMVFIRPFKGLVSEIKFPLAIKKLSLSGIGLPWTAMSIIGKLPNLQVLKLVSNAFVGEEWETTDDEFQELRFLRLEKADLKKWTAYCEHFPRLQFLVLYLCWELQEIPSDLGNIPTLQTIEVSYSSYGASMSAVQIEIEQNENGNEELNVIINSREWSKEQLVLACAEGTD